jgi:hypothetical protein
LGDLWFGSPRVLSLFLFIFQQFHFFVFVVSCGISSLDSLRRKVLFRRSHRTENYTS